MSLNNSIILCKCKKKKKGRVLYIILKNDQKWSNSFSVIYNLNYIIASIFSAFSLFMPIFVSVLSWKLEHKTYFFKFVSLRKIEMWENLHNRLWIFCGHHLPYVYIYQRDVSQIFVLLSLTIPSPKKYFRVFILLYSGGSILLWSNVLWDVLISTIFSQQILVSLERSTVVLSIFDEYNKSLNTLYRDIRSIYFILKCIY